MTDKIVKVQSIRYSELGWHYARECSKCHKTYGVWYPDVHTEQGVPETRHNCEAGGYDYVR